MIIIFSNAAINQKAKHALLALQEQNVFSLEDISEHAQNPLVISPEDNTLTIVELSANGNLQKMYSPSILARRLFFLGFLKHIDTVQLLISDIIPQRSMLAFATELSYAIIKQQSDSNIAIRVPASITDCTLIEPPEESAELWSLYKISPKEINHPPAKDGAFDFYKQQMACSVTGPITEILQHPAYTISAQKVRDTYSESPALDDTEFDLKL